MISVEFAHIYLDENPSIEHVKGKEALINLISNQTLKAEELDIVTLLDDYNALKDVLNVSAFISFLNEDLPQEVKVLYESDMILYAPLVLEYLHKDDAKSYYRYIGKNNKYPCSLLAMTSYLIRLQIIQPRLFGKDLEKCDRLVNILSERFRGVEEIIIHKLKKSKLSGIENFIETFYIESTSNVYVPIFN